MRTEAHPTSSPDLESNEAGTAGVLTVDLSAIIVHLMRNGKTVKLFRVEPCMSVREVWPHLYHVWIPTTAGARAQGRG